LNHFWGIANGTGRYRFRRREGRETLNFDPPDRDQPPSPGLVVSFKIEVQFKGHSPPGYYPPMSGYIDFGTLLVDIIYEMSSPAFFIHQKTTTEFAKGCIYSGFSWLRTIKPA
jgi:hypothetical protein